MTLRLMVSSLVGLLLAVTVAPPVRALERNKRAEIMRAVARLVILKRRGNRFIPMGNGSGSVISADGLILTNNHVVANIKTQMPYDAIAVTLTTQFDRKPKPICLAKPSRAIRDPGLDLAVIKCEYELNGAPLRRKINWPTMAIGDSSKMIPGDELYIVGYPAVAGATITFTAGKVAGFLDDRRSGGQRAWIKTDAMIARGVSGGSAFNGKGELVGVPTQLRWRRGGRTNIGLARPIAKGRMLLARVIGKKWDRIARRRHGVGRPIAAAPAAPPGATRPNPGGLQPGVRPRQNIPRGAPRAPNVPPARPGRYGGRATPDRGGATPGQGGATPDPDSRTPRQRARRRRGSYVAGVVVDAMNMRPIPGAVVMILHPGVRVRSLTRSTLLRQVATLTSANSRGQFRTRQALPHGSRYGILVSARGYRLLGLNDAIALFPGTPPLLNVGLVKLQPNAY